MMRSISIHYIIWRLRLKLFESNVGISQQKSTLTSNQAKTVGYDTVIYH